MADISLLFDVAGQGSITGESGDLINRQLTEIVTTINKTPFGIKFQADPESLKTLSAQIQEITKSLGEVGNVQIKVTGIKKLITALEAVKVVESSDGAAVNLIKAFNDIANAAETSSKRRVKAANDANTAEAGGTSSNTATGTITRLSRVRKLETDAEKILKTATAAKHGKTAADYELVQNTLADIQALRTGFENGIIGINEFDDSFQKLRGTIDKSNKRIKDAGEYTQTLGEKFAKATQKLSLWFSATQVVTMLYRLGRKMVTNVVDIDKAMTELKKVTDETAATYDRFLNNATKRAKTLGATISDTVTATADFARLGYGIKDAEKLADAAIVYKNVGDGIENISDASESIISTMKAFNVPAEQAMFIVDKFNKIGNEFAITSKGVGDSLLRSAAAMASANNTLDQTIALATAGNEIVQNPETIGTSLKTISMYLRAAKTEAEEAGESTDGMANSVSELRGELLKLTGNKVDIQIDEDTFKSTYDILGDLAKVWKDLSDVSRANILEMIGGKRNANTVAAIIENFDTAQEVLAASANAEGSALAENEKVLTSIEGKWKQLNASFQEFSTNVANSSVIKFILDIGRGILNFLNLGDGVLVKLALMSTAIYGVSAALSAFSQTQIATTAAMAVANKGFGKTIGYVTVELLKSAAAWAKTPWGAATIALAGIQAIVAISDAIAGAKEKAARESIDELNIDIDNQDAEIKALEELSGKLDAAKGSKAELAKIQSELNEVIGDTPGLINAEADAYELAAAKLRATIALEREQRDVLQQNKVRQSEKLFNNNVYERTGKNISAQEMRRLAKDYAKGYRVTFNKSEWEAYWGEQAEIAYDIFADTISSYTGYGGQSLVKNLIASSVRSGAGISEISDTINTIINNSGLQSAINDYFESLTSSDSNTQEYADKLKTSFNDLANVHPELKSFLDDFYRQILAGGSAATQAASDVKTLKMSIDDLKDASDAISSVSKAFNEFAENKYVTTDTIAGLREATGLSGDEWEKYENKLLSSKLTTAQLTSVLSELTYKILETKFAKEGLENATEAEVAAVLRENGVLNANALAHNAVNTAKADAILSGYDFANMTEDQIIPALSSELEFLGLTESALESLVMAYVTAQNSMTEAARESVRSRLLLTEAEFESISSAADARALALSKDSSYIDGDPAATQAYLQALSQAEAYGAAREKARELLEKLVNNKKPNFSVKHDTKTPSNKDEPDFADATDAIINRIGADIDALEKQSKIIDNQLDMVDAEKEYDKYVELTNKALDNRLKTIEASKTAQKELSKEAQKIRDKYSQYDVDSFFDANGEYTEAYYRVFNSFSSGKKQEAFANDMESLQKYKQAWFEYYDEIIEREKEVSDLRKDLQDAHYDHLSNLIDQLERYAQLQKEQAEDEKERYDYLIEKTKALLGIKKAQFDIENKLISAEIEAQKALETSKIGSQYLDEETRHLVYNDDDYALEMDKIDEIEKYVNDITDEYISKLNKLGEEEIYKAEEITEQYERRLALKEKELEIVQAEVDLQKKQDALNNVLAEKNIRQIVDGKWVWTNDTNEVRRATEELADAQAEVDRLEREKEHLEFTNRLENQIGLWEIEKASIDASLEELDDNINEFSTKLELLQDPLMNFGAIVAELTSKLANIEIPDTSASGSSSASKNNSNYQNSADWYAYWGSYLSTNTPTNGAGGSLSSGSSHPLSNKIAQVGSDGKAPAGLKSGDLVVTGGGTYQITGVKSDGSYQSNKVSSATTSTYKGNYDISKSKTPSLYDSGGVLKGLGGIKATLNDEIVLPPDITEEILTPESNKEFTSFIDSLRDIFGLNITSDKLRDFYSSVGLSSPFGKGRFNSKTPETGGDRVTQYNNYMYGDFNVHNADNSDEIMRKFITFIQAKPVVS